MGEIKIARNRADEPNGHTDRQRDQTDALTVLNTSETGGR